ncbi:urease accessory protein UreH domain-containing protein [Nonomuraea cavernae]|uniref:urease accessory protein UreH domain-containing protein n=1 Tax=Nonomuraea cavernae TaxID=2045107 RepID=UPI0021E6B5AE|nr:sulfite exporter TauE/SafE family protein [Nonomuraea cavernae]
MLASGLAAGLLAGTASCAAVQGGLLVGLMDRSPGPATAPRSTRAAGKDETCSARPSTGDPSLIGWFLAGRLVAYSAVGALLGLLGAAVSLPPAARALLLVAAGVTVIVFAVRLLRRTEPGCAPPARQTRRLAAPLLGAATILVPCGVTIGMEMVAVSSGSPLGGAAVMAGFVLGTAPAFALLGYVLRRVSRTRVARLAGVVALAAGLWTIGTGLNLGGWLPRPTLSAAASAGVPTTGSARTHETGTHETGTTGTTGTAVAEGGRRVTVWAMRDGYRPGIVTARAGVPVEVVFKLVDQGCTGTVVLDGRDITLPATVTLPPQPAGTMRYTCAMGMYTGFIEFS